MLEVLQRHGFRTGTVLPSSPSLTPFHPGAASELIGKVGWNGADGRAAIGNRSRPLGFSRPPPDAVSVWPHDQIHATASIYGPVDRANFLGRHYSKLAQNPSADCGCAENIQFTREGCPKQGAGGPRFPEKAMSLVIRVQYSEIKCQNRLKLVD